jgi:hypothetical protein
LQGNNQQSVAFLGKQTTTKSVALFKSSVHATSLLILTKISELAELAVIAFMSFAFIQFHFWSVNVMAVIILLTMYIISWAFE